MTEIPQAAVDAAIEVLKPYVSSQDDAEMYGDIAGAAIEAAEPHIAAAERERIRHALLACRTCGKIHEPLPVTRQFEAPNWASSVDGHSYSPAWVWMRGDLGSIVQAVIEKAEQDGVVSSSRLPGEPCAAVLLLTGWLSPGVA